MSSGHFPLVIHKCRTGKGSESRSPRTRRCYLKMPIFLSLKHIPKSHRWIPVFLAVDQTPDIVMLRLNLGLLCFNTCPFLGRSSRKKPDRSDYEPTYNKSAAVESYSTFECSAGPDKVLFLPMQNAENQAKDVPQKVNVP